jgi:hypothetical protein
MGKVIGRTFSAVRGALPEILQAFIRSDDRAPSGDAVASLGPGTHGGAGTLDAIDADDTTLVRWLLFRASLRLVGRSNDDFVHRNSTRTSDYVGDRVRDFLCVQLLHLSQGSREIGI